MQKSIVHKWSLEYTPDVVWEYLTDSKLLEQWLMKNDFEPIVGHKFTFGTKPKINLGFDGIVHCEVLKVVPNKQLSYSWRSGTGKKVLLDTIVTWTLTPKDGGTELLLEHRGFKGVRNYIPHIILSKGWLKLAKRLVKCIKLTIRIIDNI